MAYKRYFKRDGKTFGPYYYESYRDKNGDVKKRYIGKDNPEKKKFPVGKLVFGGLVLFAVIAIVFVSVQVSLWDANSGQRAADGGIVGSVKGFVSNSFSRIVGFVVEDGGSTLSEELIFAGDLVNEVAPQEEPQEEIEVVEEIDVGVMGGVEEIDVLSEEVVENESGVIEEVENESGVGFNESGEVNVSEVENKSGVVEVNITEELNESVEVEVNVTGELNESVVNVSEVVVSVKQYKAVVNRRVKWIKKVVVPKRDDSGEPNESGGVSIDLPSGAENIVIRTGDEVDEAEDEAEEYDSLVGEIDKGDIVDGTITGFVSKDILRGRGILTRLWIWIRGFTISGNVIDEADLGGDIVKTVDGKVVDLDRIIDEELAKGGEAKVAVEYYTEAPLAEENDTDRGVRVVVSASDDLNYSDILAYSVLDNRVRVNSSRLKIYWLKEVEVVSEKVEKENKSLEKENKSLEKEEKMKEEKVEEKDGGAAGGGEMEVEKNKTKEEKEKKNKTEVVENVSDEVVEDLNESVEVVDEVVDDEVVVDEGFDGGDEKEKVEKGASQDDRGQVTEDGKKVKEEKGGSSKDDSGEPKVKEVDEGEGDLDLVDITGGVISWVDGKGKVETEIVWVEVEYDGYDLDGDGFVDYVEWVVPHLSSQTYEIIYISGAEHLDENRSFVEDIYDDVSAKDDNWSKVIPDGDYVRVSFERLLDSSKDITIFARAKIVELGVGSLELGDKNESVMINGTEVPYDVYLKKKRIDEIRVGG